MPNDQLTDGGPSILQNYQAFDEIRASLPRCYDFFTPSSRASHAQVICESLVGRHAAQVEHFELALVWRVVLF